LSAFLNWVVTFTHAGAVPGKRAWEDGLAAGVAAALAESGASANWDPGIANAKAITRGKPTFVNLVDILRRVLCILMPQIYTQIIARFAPLINGN